MVRCLQRNAFRCSATAERGTGSAEWAGFRYSGTAERVPLQAADHSAEQRNRQIPLQRNQRNAIWHSGIHIAESAEQDFFT